MEEKHGPPDLERLGSHFCWVSCLLVEVILGGQLAHLQAPDAEMARPTTSRVATRLNFIEPQLAACRAPSGFTRSRRSDMCEMKAVKTFHNRGDLHSLNSRLGQLTSQGDNDRAIRCAVRRLLYLFGNGAFIYAMTDKERQALAARLTHK